MEYKIRLVNNILREIKFKSSLVELDRGLITSISKLISLEGVPHFKEKWKGEPEKIVFINEDAKKPEVKKDIMDNIISELNSSFKQDNKEINLDPIDIKDVNIKGLVEFWKKYYKETRRNILIIALGGVLRRKGILEEEAKKILKQLLEAVGSADFNRRTNELLYSYQHKKENVAVLFHLKKGFEEEEAIKVYNELKSFFLKKEEIEYKKARLSQLNATYINQKVSVDCQITGEQSQKAIPKSIMVKCLTCSDTKLYHSLDTPEIFCSERQMKSILNDLKNKNICACVTDRFEEDAEEHRKPCKTTKIMGYIDHSILFVRDLLSKEQFTQTKYEPKRIFVVGSELPKTKVINVKGKVIIEPKTNNISIVADKVRPLKNQVEDFRITEELKEEFKEYFTGTIELSEEINPDIVGAKRKIAKQSIIAQLHSPCQIYDIERKKIMRGGLNIIFYGDTKVGKSELAKDVTNKRYFGLGEYGTLETGGRTGFLYTIDTDKGALIWGSLPLNDMGLVVLDGLQSIGSSEMAEFREALELQEVIVNRSVKGSALARTRIIGCLNPNKPMNQYIFKCEALQDNNVFCKTPELTRWDLFLPFCHKDVSSKEIAERTYKDRKIPKKAFIDHIYWVWSRRPQQIEYTEAAVKEIREKSQELNDEYSLECLPVVHNGVRDVLTRLCVSKAAEMHSTDETHEKIIVEKDHVNKAVQFYKETLNLMDLDKYREEITGKIELTDDEMINIAKDLGNREYQILDLIKHERKSSSQLAAALDVSDRTIKEHYKKLKEHELIETKQGKGIGLSVKGIKFVRWGLYNSSEIVKKSFTTEKDGEEKLHHFTREIHTPLQKKADEKVCSINNSQELYEFVKQRDKGEGVEIHYILKNCPSEDEGERFISELKRKGDVCENPVGFLRIMK